MKIVKAPNLTNEKLHIISWSGGKDSTASIILAHEHNIPIGLIVMSVVWFDKERKIYGENPNHLEWVFNTAKPLFESWGYKVEIITSKKDYNYHFHRIIKKSAVAERNGKMEGYVLAGKCRMNGEKTAAIHRYLKLLNTDYDEYVGIAINETERLSRLKEKKGKLSLLEKYNYTEEMAKELCGKYGLLSPVYALSNRGGCWFCPNQSIRELADLKENHIDLWQELVSLSETKNKVSEKFRYGKTFEQISEEVDIYIKNCEERSKNVTYF